MTGNRSLAILQFDLGAGGAERVCINIANEMARRGYQVTLLLVTAGGPGLKLLDPRIRVVDLNLRRMRSALWPLVRFLRREKPDALLAAMWPLTVMAVAARRFALARTRVYVAEHTTWSQSPIVRAWPARTLIRSSMRLLFPGADRVITVSKGAAGDLAVFASFDRARIEVIYNPVVRDAAPVAPAADLPPQGWSNGPHKKILAVGTLKPVKDYATLLAAFAILRQTLDARLLILGEGQTRAALEAQAQALGIAGDVDMPGFVDDPAPYYRQADLHVLSSTYEGLPTVVIEALAAGTPVVSTDCPHGPREILMDGAFGRLTPVGDAPAMAAAMLEALAAPRDRAALMARAQDFSVTSAVSRYENLMFPAGV